MEIRFDFNTHKGRGDSLVSQSAYSLKDLGEKNYDKVDFITIGLFDSVRDAALFSEKNVSDLLDIEVNHGVSIADDKETQWGYYLTIKVNADYSSREDLFHKLESQALLY